eukprot:10751314-Ditylum_brightwellii.AAC.1
MESNTSYKRAANRASSARCLVAMLNYIPLTTAIKGICCLTFLMDTRRNEWTGPRRKSFVPWQKLSRRPLVRAKKLGRGCITTHLNQTLPWKRNYFL